MLSAKGVSLEMNCVPLQHFNTPGRIVLFDMQQTFLTNIGAAVDLVDGTHVPHALRRPRAVRVVRRPQKRDRPTQPRIGNVHL